MQQKRTLPEVIALMEKTIAQKRQYAKDLRADTLTSMAEAVANEAVASFIDINVEELERIVDDLKSL